jgi:hypothetical protein
MKNLEGPWLYLTIASAAALAAVYACISATGQTAPGLSISLNTNNTVSLTVTNGVSTGLYQIHWTEFLDPPGPDWLLLTNGSVGQTQFVASMGDLDMAFFRAVNNTNFAPPNLSVIILSPTNGAVVY